MVEKRFLLKNDAWKNYTQPGELTREGFLPADMNIFIVQIGKNYFLHIGDLIGYHFPKEDYPEMYETVSELSNGKCKVGVRSLSVSGKAVKSELIIKKFYDDPGFSYLISQEEAEKLLDVCVSPVRIYSKYYFGMKKDYYSSEDPQVWWVKEYVGPYTGIKLTGVTLKKADEEIIFPDWVGAELHHNPEDFCEDLASLKPTKIEEALGHSPVFKKG